MDKYVLKIIAACQIIGAVVGGVIVYQMLRFAEVEPEAQPLFIVLVSVLGLATLLALVAGVLLWARRPTGLGLSLLVQALQVPLITSSGLKYKLMFGAGAWICVEPGDELSIRVPINFGAAEAIAINPGLPLLVGVNLVALCFGAVLLLTLLRERGGGLKHSAQAH
jgi:hypothetical protein